MKDQEARKQYAKEYYSKNKEKWKNYSKGDRVKNRERNKEYGKMYREKNKEKLREKALAWRLANKEKCTEYWKKSHSIHSERIRVRGSLWKRVNRKKISADEKRRRKEDLNFAIKKRLKSRVWHSVNRQSGKKAKRTMELLGCTIASFRIYIESKFQPGMTWENIHLDHIVPCALFDLRKPEHQKICFHFSNYQPLFPIDNLKKKDRLFHEPGHLPL